jgi:hypothetical protein
VSRSPFSLAFSNAAPMIALALGQRSEAASEAASEAPLSSVAAGFYASV